MGATTQLRKTLKSLCFNSEWKYAIFWKLKHRDQMMLTWEDVYFDLHDGNHSHDPLGSAVAKMSYHAYSIGEGIVGQVAATGKHHWIFENEDLTNFCSSFEDCNGCQAQFAAGIKTIVVIDVVPHGVLQLGSLNKVIEDLKLVKHIRNIFFTLQNSSPGCSMQSSLLMSDTPTRSSGLENFHDCLYHLDKAVNKEMPTICSALFPSRRENDSSSSIVPLPGVQQNGAANKHEELDSHTPSANLCQSNWGRNCQKLQIKPVSDRNCEGETSYRRDPSQYLKHHDTPSAYNLLNSASCNEVNFNGVEKNLGFARKFNDMDKLHAALKFSIGCELHEALGSGFVKQNLCYMEGEIAEAVSTVETPEETGSCVLVSQSDPEHLLEALVASVCQSEGQVRSEKSISKSVQSLLTSDKVQDPSTEHATRSEGYLIDLVGQGTQYSQNITDGCALTPTRGISLTSQNEFSEKLERSLEPAKMSKKRARPGESSRPRPRDRQLIQDRIRELRELVPSGSKCSIDSLLERTIKHMLFLQGITKHADELNTCVQSKLRNKETSALGSSSYEQGSSWAVEVGSHLKVCPIIVENLNVNGQILVEMMCEECSHFLEIAESIRGLGLTILKGETENCGEKTWMCFVVEGQDDRCMHRMDLLWSLVQILQSKKT